MKIKPVIKLESSDYDSALDILNKAMSHEKEMTMAIRDDLKHALCIALEQVAEEAYLIGLKKGMEDR